MRVNNTCRQHLHHCVFSLAPNRSDKLKGVRVKIHTALSHFNTTELFRKSLALSMMAKANNKHFLSVVAVLISFAFGEGSFVTYNTQVGCNATLVCNQIGNVTWIYTATSENVEGERFQSQTHAFFSTLSIIDVSQSDNKNITCMAEGHNLTINVAVCYDRLQERQCRSTIDADPTGQTCNKSYFVEYCKKSCGLCPEPNCTEAVLPTLPPTTEPNCTEAVLPTLPPTTANPQTTQDADTQPTSESRSTVSSSTRDVDQGERFGNSGVELGFGLHNVYGLASSLFAMTVLEFLNY